MVVSIRVPVRAAVVTAPVLFGAAPVDGKELELLLPPQPARENITNIADSNPNIWLGRFMIC